MVDCHLVRPVLQRFFSDFPKINCIPRLESFDHLNLTLLFPSQTGASKQHAEIFELTKIVMSMNLDDKPPMTAEQFDRLVDSVVAQTKLNVKNKSGDAYEPFAQFRSVRPCEDCSGNHQH